MSAEVERKPLQRQKMPSGKTIYYHPHGYRIVPEERDWSDRGTVQPGWAGPKRWFEVKPRYTKTRRPLFTAEKLGDARSWCDKNPRWSED